MAYKFTKVSEMLTAARNLVKQMPKDATAEDIVTKTKIDQILIENYEFLQKISYPEMLLAISVVEALDKRDISMDTEDVAHVLTTRMKSRMSNSQSTQT